MDLLLAPCLFFVLLFAPPGFAGDDYSLERLTAPQKDGVEEKSAADAGALPEEVPEAFASELSKEGFRLAAADGSPIYDLWLRRRVPLAEKRSTQTAVRFGELEEGTFIGVLRSYGVEYDYYENPIDKGVYVLRYGVQPDTGDHMGTAESRDFLVLTHFEQDQKPERVKDMEALIDLAVEASPAGHPMILYLVKPRDAKAKTPRVYHHERREEWIADLRLETAVKENGNANANGNTNTNENENGGEKGLRLGIVLIGISESV